VGQPFFILTNPEKMERKTEKCVSCFAGQILANKNFDFFDFLPAFQNKLKQGTRTLLFQNI
jgi:hypothetical protein